MMGRPSRPRITLSVAMRSGAVSTRVPSRSKMMVAMAPPLTTGSPECKRRQGNLLPSPASRAIAFVAAALLPLPLAGRGEEPPLQFDRHVLIFCALRIELLRQRDVAEVRWTAAKEI